MERTCGLLYKAAYEGNVTTLRELVQQDRLIHDRLIIINNNGFSETPLHVAAMLGHVEFVKEIIIHKPELAKELDNQHFTPLHLASAKGHLETVKVLLSAVDDHNLWCYAWDEEGRNPLHLAAMRGRLDVLRELLRVAPQAARVNLNGRSETILHVCVRHNQLEALKFLMNVVDDYQFVNAKDDYGMTGLHLAVAHKHIEVTAKGSKDRSFSRVVFNLFLAEPESDFAGECDTFLWKPTSGITCIEESVGSVIVWPTDKFIMR